MEGGGGIKPSLADWKAGQKKMTTAFAGELVTKAAPKQKPKVSASAKAKQPGKEKSWAEKSIEERFGTQPKQVVMAKQLLDVLRYLESQQERGVITWAELVERAMPPWYDTAPAGQLFNELTNNPRVEATAEGFAYRSDHQAKDKASLLRHIRAHPEGVRYSDVKDGYSNVLRDADELHAEGLIFKFYNAEFKVDVYFAAPEVRTNAPADLADVYLKTQLPNDPQELMVSLRHMGVRSALASVTSQRRPIALPKAERVKKKRKMQVRHMTNTHMAHMFTGAAAEQYTSID
eukprot:GHRR01004762.1.p1 GENE.GHRR01004762.1~~GHRR01004762.1.p1  ORF type:complete len:290 (+),score=88.55 GHRR01004762.1:243-1112(+)